MSHLGAALADAALQAGLNYGAVVKPRVRRLEAVYPEAATVSGVARLVRAGCTPQLLAWRHPEKIARFERVVFLLLGEGVDSAADLRAWLIARGARERLLSVRGVGPKTYDYLCGLLGLERVAVDRHVTSFAREAGVVSDGYEELRVAVSFAADLLGLPRREFDTWVWRRQSSRKQTHHILNRDRT